MIAYEVLCRRHHRAADHPGGRAGATLADPLPFDRGRGRAMT